MYLQHLQGGRNLQMVYLFSFLCIQLKLHITFKSVVLGLRQTEELQEQPQVGK